MNIRFISITNKSTRNLKGNIKALKGTYIVYVLLCAIFLLGIVLGRDNTYLYLYFKQGHPILKNKE